jgi:uncharacterized protein (TIGR03086 family)
MTTPSERFRANASRFTEIVSAVPRAAWSNPTPCAEWTARDIVHHVVSTQLEFLARMPFAPADSPSTDDPLTAWPTVRDLVQASLDDPSSAGHTYDGYFGPTTFEASIDTFYATDLTVHGWDLARAAGLDAYQPIDPAEIERVRAPMGDLGDAMRAPGLFAEPVPVADDAPEQARLLAWLGRDPHWSS